MALVNPSQSQPGDTIEAADINTPVNQLAAQINGNLDSTNLANNAVTTAKITDGTITETKFATARPSEYLSDHVVSGGTVAQSAGLVGTFQDITYVVGGQRYTAISIANKTYTASKDTYVDIGTDGTVDYNEVSNGAASPALSASHIRVAKVVTNGSAITSVTQVGSDSLGNVMYPLGAVNASELAVPYKFSAYRSGDVSTAGGFVYTKVPLDAEEYDTGLNFDSTTNYRFVAPVAGYYRFSGLVTLFVVNGIVARSALCKNGAIARQGTWIQNNSGGNNTLTTAVAGTLFLAANDYVELFVAQNSGGTQTLNGTASLTYLDGMLVSRA